MSEPLHAPYRPTLLRPAAIGVGGAVLVGLAVVLWLGLRAPDIVPTPTLPVPALPATAPPSSGVAAQAQATPMPGVPAPIAPPSIPAQPAPSFDVVRVAPGGDAVLAGRAAPGAQVTITNNGTEIGRTQADQHGQWVVLPSAPLPAGGQELAVTATTGSGQETKGDAPVLLLVPPAAPPATAPSTTAPSATSSAAIPPAAIAILAPPGGAPSLLPSTPPAQAKLGLGVVDYDDHGGIRFAGTAPPGATVRVYIYNTPAGDAKADAQGQWHLQPADGVAAGNHQLRLDQLAGGAQVGARVELPFQRARLAARDIAQGGLTPGKLIVQPSQNLWRIARATYGHGIEYMAIYQANREQIRDPNLIYPGQVFAMPASSSASR